MHELVPCVKEKHEINFTLFFGQLKTGFGFGLALQLLVKRNSLLHTNTLTCAHTNINYTKKEIKIPDHQQTEEGLPWSQHQEKLLVSVLGGPRL